MAQLDYIQANTALEPYEVWIKKVPGVTSQEIYDEILEKEIKIVRLTDTSQEIIKTKNDPMLQGTNGALTLGFIVTMSVSTIGFLIYWILSIRQRELQFGIFRAMGLSVRKIIGLLAWEQLLISGTAILIGVTVGGLTSQLFVPLLQMVYSAAEQVPLQGSSLRTGLYKNLYGSCYYAIRGYRISGHVHLQDKDTPGYKAG